MINSGYHSAYVAGNSLPINPTPSVKNPPAVQTIPSLTNLVYDVIESTSRQVGLECYSAMSQKFTPKNSSNLPAI